MERKVGGFREDLEAEVVKNIKSLGLGEIILEICIILGIGGMGGRPNGKYSYQGSSWYKGLSHVDNDEC